VSHFAFHYIWARYVIFARQPATEGPMLFKSRFLKLIADGEVRIAFRKWTKPTIKQGGTLLTPVGKLRIQSLKIIEESRITKTKLYAAGYESMHELAKELEFKSAGQIYEIHFELEADPRIKLRKKKEISEAEFAELSAKLQRLDRSDKAPNWTRRILEEVKSQPGQQAAAYAAVLGYEKEWFKLNIRKLKNLGLTISLPNGYEISPRGHEYLRLLKRR